MYVEHQCGWPIVYLFINYYYFIFLADRLPNLKGPLKNYENCKTKFIIHECLVWTRGQPFIITRDVINEIAAVVDIDDVKYVVDDDYGILLSVYCLIIIIFNI